jgi:hypothetical protein
MAVTAMCCTKEEDDAETRQTSKTAKKIDKASTIV